MEAKIPKISPILNFRQDDLAGLENGEGTSPDSRLCGQVGRCVRLKPRLGGFTHSDSYSQSYCETSHFKGADTPTPPALHDYTPVCAHER